MRPGKMDLTFQGDQYGPTHATLDIQYHGPAGEIQELANRLQHNDIAEIIGRGGGGGGGGTGTRFEISGSGPSGSRPHHVNTYFQTGKSMGKSTTHDIYKEAADMMKAKKVKPQPRQYEHVEIERTQNGYIVRARDSNPHSSRMMGDPGEVYVFESTNALNRWLVKHMPQPLGDKA